MPYPYGTQNAPAVGNGLGGLPRRAAASTPTPTVAEYQDFAVVLVATSPFVHVYKRVGDTLVAVDAADHGLTIPSNARNAQFSPSGRYLAIALNNGTRNIFRIWKCSRGVFTFLRDIDETWIYTTYFPMFSADDRVFAGGTNESDNVKNVVAYRIDTTTDTFTRVPDLTNQQSGAISSPAISSDGTFLAVANQTNGGVTYYKWNGTNYVYSTLINSGGYASHPAFSSDDGMSLFFTNSSAGNKIYTVSRGLDDTWSASTQLETTGPGGSLDRYQLIVRNNFFLYNDKFYLTYSPTNMPVSSATGYADAFNASPNADASYFFSTGYYSRTLRLMKRTALSKWSNVAETGILTGSSSSGANLATRVTVATVRMN